MDYSSPPASDQDHLAGASPWASSPNPDRTSFEQPSNFPTSPLPPQSPYAEIAEHESQGFAAERPPPAVSEQPPSSSQPAENGGNHADAPSQAQAQPGQQDPQRKQEPQRYRPRQNVPQHKLQAKVTGLERTDRKDPILRFDVYVCTPHALCLSSTDRDRPIFPNSAPLNSAMSAVHIRSL
jgi:hypothetical protein